MKGEAFSVPHLPSNPLIICIDGSPVSPSTCPLRVNDSLHFTLQEPRKTLWPFFPVKSEEIDRGGWEEKRCDRAIWLRRSWLSWCGEELAQDKHVRKTKKALLLPRACRPFFSWKSRNPKSFAARHKLLGFAVSMRPDVQVAVAVKKGHTECNG